MKRFKLTLSVAAVTLTILAACGESAPTEPSTTRDPAGRAGYLEPPRVTELSVGAEGLRLAGRAAPLATVRLASPEGETSLTKTNADGAFVIVLARSDAPRIYGLSMTAEDRTIQAEGYVLVLPAPKLVVLRAGAGAVVKDRVAEPKIQAFDYDAEGGAVVSGVGPAGATISALIDGRPAATNGRVGEDGRFSLPFGAPITGGEHRIAVQGDGFQASARVAVTPGEDPETGAFRSVPTPYGERIDWLTPGGGLQSTLLLD